MKPLAVTFSHNWFTDIGTENLNRLIETFDLDHIMYTPRRSLVNKIAKRSIEQIGDSCWHCHAGVGAFVIQIAIKYEIPLIVWGESTAEEGCRISYHQSTRRIFLMKIIFHGYLQDKMLNKWLAKTYQLKS